MKLKIIGFVGLLIITSLLLSFVRISQNNEQKTRQEPVLGKQSEATTLVQSDNSIKIVDPSPTTKPQYATKTSSPALTPAPTSAGQSLPTQAPAIVYIQQPTSTPYVYPTQAPVIATPAPTSQPVVAAIDCEPAYALIASWEAEMQSEIEKSNIAIATEFAKRGIPSSSGIVQQEQEKAAEEIRNRYNILILQFQLQSSCF